MKKTEQEVLGTDIVVPEMPGFIDGKFDDALGPGSQPDFAGIWLIAAADNELDTRADFAKIDAETNENLGSHPLLFPQQTKKDVLGTDVAMIEVLSFFLG